MAMLKTTCPDGGHRISIECTLLSKKINWIKNVQSAHELSYPFLASWLDIQQSNRCKAKALNR